MIWTKKDDLIGDWFSGADDGSGFHEMVWGFGVTFNADGTGTRQEWSSDEVMETEEEEVQFEWQRVNENTIQIKLEEDWEQIQYETAPFKGAYEMRYQKLTSKGTDAFWSFHEPVYKALVQSVSTTQKVALIILLLVVFIALIMIRYSQN